VRLLKHPCISITADGERQPGVGGAVGSSHSGQSVRRIAFVNSWLPCGATNRRHVIRSSRQTPESLKCSRDAFDTQMAPRLVSSCCQARLLPDPESSAPCEPFVVHLPVQTPQAGASTSSGDVWKLRRLRYGAGHLFVGDYDGEPLLKVCSRSFHRGAD